MTIEFNLYGSEGCHLCEDALALCLSVMANEQVNVVDIIDDEALVALYRVHIPVLERLDSQQKLFWPFSQAQLLELL